MEMPSSGLLSLAHGPKDTVGEGRGATTGTQLGSLFCQRFHLQVLPSRDQFSKAASYRSRKPVFISV